MTSTKDRVVDATTNVRPYIERALRDQELRQNVQSAYASARTLYDELLSRKDVGGVATKLVTDDSLRDELRNVVEQLRKAAGRAQTATPAAPQSGRRAKSRLLLFAGIALGLLFNPVTGPPLRRWLKKKAFGGGGGPVDSDSNGRGV
jgi:hypothetical protein